LIYFYSSPNPSSNEYKVVIRPVETKIIKRQTPSFRHSVGLLGGRAKSKLNVDVTGTTVHSSVGYEAVVGLEYRLTHSSGYFGEFAILSNDTILMGLGKEF